MPLDGTVDAIKGPFEAMTFKIGNPSRDLTLGYGRSISFLGKLFNSERKRDERMKAQAASREHDSDEDTAAQKDKGKGKGKKPCNNKHTLPSNSEGKKE